MEKILIAGGSGFLGSRLKHYLKSQGHVVHVLSRNPRASDERLWLPAERTIDTDGVTDTTVIVNLSGAGIDQKRWTADRKEELVRSRVETARALFELRHHFPQLKQVVNASGITAYGFDDGDRLHPETDAYGPDFLGQLVREWEAAARLFEGTVPLTILRIAVVLDAEAGAFPKLLRPVKMGFGAPIGTGEQQMPWVHVEDLVRLFEWAIREGKTGVFNTNAGNASNKELTAGIAAALGKKLWLPNVPKALIRLVFGKLADMLLYGAKADNTKVRQAGFTFQHPELDATIRKLLS